MRNNISEIGAEMKREIKKTAKMYWRVSQWLGAELKILKTDAGASGGPGRLRRVPLSLNLGYNIPPNHP